jgi:hypothetical protein
MWFLLLYVFQWQCISQVISKDLTTEKVEVTERKEVHFQGMKI